MNIPVPLASSIKNTIPNQFSLLGTTSNKQIKHIPMLMQYRGCFVQVITNWCPSFYLQVWYVANVVAKSFHYSLRKSSDHPHMAVESAYEMIFIIYISKCTARRMKTEWCIMSLDKLDFYLQNLPYSAVKLLCILNQAESWLPKDRWIEI